MTTEPDGGRDVDRVSQENPPECPVCERAENVGMAPEAGYWTCFGCGERGAGTEEPIWWRNDPESMWYVEDDEEIVTDGGHEEISYLTDRWHAEAEYELYKEHGRPTGPYTCRCLECGDQWECGELFGADHDVRRHAGYHGGLYGEHAEIVVCDKYGRELFRQHALPDDDGQPLFADSKCESCGNPTEGVSCSYCGYIPEEHRA